MGLNCNRVVSMWVCVGPGRPNGPHRPLRGCTVAPQQSYRVSACGKCETVFATSTLSDCYLFGAFRTVGSGLSVTFGRTTSPWGIFRAVRRTMPHHFRHMTPTPKLPRACLKCALRLSPKVVA